MNLPTLEKKEEGSAIDSIEHELYDPKSKVGEGEIHQARPHKAVSLPTSWGNDDPLLTKGNEDKGISFGTKLFLISTLLLFAALGFSAWRVFSLRNVVSSSNIDMTAYITPYVEGGAATPLTITIHNRNTSPLESANVTLLYKQGSGSQDEQNKIQEKRDLGAIRQDEYKKQDFTVALYGRESESREIVLKLEYKVAGSNAVFSKLINTQVVLSTPPVSVHAEGPTKLSVGQGGDFVFTVKNNSATTSLPAVLQIVLPNSFKLEKTSPNPISRSTSWSIPAIPSGDVVKITLSGSFDGKQGEVGTFQAKVGSQGSNPTVIGDVYSSEVIDVTLRANPLTLTMNLSSDGGTGEVVRYGDKITLTFNYNNGSLQALEDVSIKLSLSGDAPLYSSINPISGYYDSLAKTITWDKASLPDLAVLPPGGQGTLQVVIPIVPRGNNSPTITATIVGSASTKTSNDIVTTLSKTWGVQGIASLEASTQYKNSPFPNSGPIPPLPNKETTYTVHLKAMAQNALSAVKVSFVLPAYVTWKGVTSDAAGITYDTRTRTVTWNVKGLTQGSFVTADIVLGVKPSQSHVGQSPPITSGIILDADEEVSRAHLRSVLSSLTTAVKNEMWPENPSVVVDR